MILTIFCAVMLLAFIGCLIATGSAYVLFGAFLLIMLLTALLRRPIRYRENRWIFVFYRFTLRVVPATETITGNPNEIKLYQRDRGSKHSFIALRGSEETEISGMSLYRYKGRRLFVLFPVPGLLRAVWQANLFFALAASAFLIALASVGFLPYERLRHTERLLKQTETAELLHSEADGVINDPVYDNILLICRDPENGADLLELLSFRHSGSAVMPLYLNPGLLAETSPGQYETVSAYCKTHTAEEIAAVAEENYCLHINDAVCFDYAGLCGAVQQAGGLPLHLTDADFPAVCRYMNEQMPDVQQPMPDADTLSWEQIHAFLHCGTPDDTTLALRKAAVTDALMHLLAQLKDGNVTLPAGTVQTSLQTDRLYKLTEMLRSDRIHYETTYLSCIADDAIGAYCIPRAGQYRPLSDGAVYAAPGIIRQYVIRLLYY